MTPEIAGQNRNIQKICIHKDPEILFREDGGWMLLQASNDRGPVEVLVAPEKQESILVRIRSGLTLDLTGFFRRRSGRRPDGSRRYIWCLIVLSSGETIPDECTPG